ncbi:hypothetical protein MF271_18915 (plasmid) [Deinococcus sp. KNUC1210]|uniref:hypothetical protein n=1 Tax=Deinococcus sp. KNUC1210 TaxID=2917691 RepID=UPI001EEFED75|nr:hypothetical protein [Deinococcus sp. KNUC1210]ULH17393.1 hypothetical protein MF271_18915 [Deinococcus sp. KNUC1210]
MTGAYVTSSGEEHRGFHQSPNVLRDVYMKRIGVDGYGFLQYLLSWANTNAQLPVRRMKQDLKVSQDKLERIQKLVLEHCGHFVKFVPGDRVTSNQWHLDMRQVWGENAAHMAKSLLERTGNEGVPEIGTQPKKARKGVPEIGTGCTGNRYTGVPEIGTFKDISKNISKEGGVLELTENAREEKPAPSVAVINPPEVTTTTDAALQNSVAPQSELPSQPPSAPDGATTTAAMVTDEDVDLLFGAESETVTASEEVPAAGGVAAVLAAAEEGHDPEATRTVLVRNLGGQKKLNALIEETPPGLAKVSRSRRAWLTEIAPHRAEELVLEARKNTTLHPWTAITELLDREIGARIMRGSATAGYVGEPGANGAATTVQNPGAGAAWVVGQQVEYGGQRCEVVSVGSTKIAIDEIESGVGHTVFAKDFRKLRRVN